MSATDWREPYRKAFREEILPVLRRIANSDDPQAEEARRLLSRIKEEGK